MCPTSPSCLADPNAAAEPPPEGPGSGFLVVVDEATIEAASCCFGLSWRRGVKGLPIPQSRQLALQHSDTPHPAETALEGVKCVVEVLGSCLNIQSGGGPSGRTSAPVDYVVLVPVVGRPLSSGCYYVVQAAGKHKGKVSACSTEEDKTTCCFCTCVNDVKPRPFDSGDEYQQVEVAPYEGKKFRAESVTADGIPPEYLRKKGWKVSIANKKYELADDAQGVDRVLRRRLPDLDDGFIGSSGGSTPIVVVGKWYVPFLFVRADGERRIKDQAKRTMFYEMTLEQTWEQICYRTNASQVDASTRKPQEVAVTATVRRRTALLGGTEAVREGSPHIDGSVMWFRAATAAGKGAVGLDKVLWERMTWEMEREGWVAGGGNGGNEERIERVERRGDGLGQWDKFACYILLERFVLRRMDRSVALTCEFRHVDKIRAKWA